MQNPSILVFPECRIIEKVLLQLNRTRGFYLIHVLSFILVIAFSIKS